MLVVSHVLLGSKLWRKPEITWLLRSGDHLVAPIRCPFTCMFCFNKNIKETRYSIERAWNDKTRGANGVDDDHRKLRVIGPWLNSPIILTFLWLSPTINWVSRGENYCTHCLVVSSSFNWVSSSLMVLLKQNMYVNCRPIGATTLSPIFSENLNLDFLIKFPLFLLLY